MEAELQKLIQIERNLLDQVAFDVLEIPKEEFYKFGSSAILLAVAEQERIKPNNKSINAKKEFDLLCESAPNASRDAIRAICLAYTSYELCFGEGSKEELTGIKAASVIWSIAMTRGFAMGAASFSPAASDAMRKKLLSMAGLSGARVKHKPTSDLKAWAEQQAKTMKGSEIAIARQLAARIPEHLADASKNPWRLIYDHLRALRNTAS